MCWVRSADWPICGVWLVPPIRLAPSASRPRFQLRLLRSRLPTSSNSQHHLSSIIIIHHRLHDGIASLYSNLLDDYRLAICIAKSCPCSQFGYLFVCDRIVCRSTALSTTFYEHPSCEHDVCALQPSKIKSGSTVDHIVTLRYFNPMRRSQSDIS